MKNGVNNQWWYPNFLHTSARISWQEEMGSDKISGGIPIFFTSCRISWLEEIDSDKISGGVPIFFTSGRISWLEEMGSYIISNSFSVRYLKTK